MAFLTLFFSRIAANLDDGLAGATAGVEGAEGLALRVGDLDAVDETTPLSSLTCFVACFLGLHYAPIRIQVIHRARCMTADPKEVAFGLEHHICARAATSRKVSHAEEKWCS